MCCRYYYADQIRDMMDDLIASQTIKLTEPLQVEPGRDIRPSDASAVIYRDGEDLSVSNMKWGFENPYAKGLIINARSETAREKNMFSDSILNRRCGIPASGFYEWDAYKARFRFFLPGELLFMAGFYREEQGVPRYTILTTEANESMKPVHDRMPLILAREEVEPWVTDAGKAGSILTKELPQLKAERPFEQMTFEW